MGGFGFPFVNYANNLQMDERITKYFGGELSEKERIKLLQEREYNEDLKKEFAAYQNVEAIASLSVSAINTVKGEKSYTLFEKERKKKKILFYIKRTTGYAAAIILLIGGTWMISKSSIQETFTHTSAVQQELYVPPGQRARIVLPDGSTVWVNAGSTLLYPSFFNDERKVFLTGEAFFDVAKDTERPFIVSTESIDIMALGTQFDVYSYEKGDYTSTTLIEGSVKVYAKGKESEGTILSPNQRLLFENGSFRLEESADRDDLLWREGIYSFKKENMENIIKKLQLYYDVDIIIKDPRILKYEYTGKFRQRDGVMEILRIIQKIHQFRIDKNEELNTITIS